MTLVVKGRGLVGGTATAEAVVSARAFTFAHGVEPSTGKVTDIRSDVRGESVRGRVLVYPFGKGSTTASSWFLETVREGNNPAAIVTLSTDLSAVIGSVMARLVYAKTIPVVAGVDYEGKFSTGARVEVDGTKSTVTLLQ